MAITERTSFSKAGSQDIVVATGTVTGRWRAIKAAQNAAASVTVIFQFPDSTPRNLILAPGEMEYGVITSIDTTDGTIRAYIDTNPPV